MWIKGILNRPSVRKSKRRKANNFINMAILCYTSFISNLIICTMAKEPHRKKDVKKPKKNKQK